MTRANDTELLAEAEDLENDKGTNAMIFDILDPFLSPNSNSSSSMHLISSPGSRSSAYPRRPKEAGTRSSQDVVLQAGSRSPRQLAGIKRDKTPFWQA
jgi:hypothetical protein